MLGCTAEIGRLFAIVDFVLAVEVSKYFLRLTPRSLDIILALTTCSQLFDPCRSHLDLIFNIFVNMRIFDDGINVALSFRIVTSNRTK